MKLFLVENNITQKKLGQMSKIHFCRINNYLNGRLVIGTDQEKKLCKALKIDFDQFLKDKIVEIKK